MIIENYTSYFHDGEVRIVKQNKNNLELWMESAEMAPEWNKDNVPLSKMGRITGKLYIERIKSIVEDDNQVEEFNLPSGYDEGTIYRFSIDSNVVNFEIWWMRFLPEYETSQTYCYKIAAEKIYWENIPTLFDKYWDDIYNDKEPTMSC